MNELESFVAHLAKRSGEAIRPYFRAQFSVETKADRSPVTIADRKAEEAMRELIVKEFPEHGILGEEFGSHQPEARYQWVLDPIDGTLNFICGGLMFVTLIALLKDGEPILGAIHQPILEELLIGNNVEARLNGARVQVRDCRQLSEARLLTTDPFLIKQRQNFAAFEELRHRVKISRTWGDGYGYLLLASGCVDIMIDPIMHPWDIMALIPTVRGAGGTITDYHGGDPIKGSSIIATSGTIHREAVQVLNSLQFLI